MVAGENIDIWSHHHVCPDFGVGWDVGVDTDAGVVAELDSCADSEIGFALDVYVFT